MVEQLRKDFFHATSVTIKHSVECFFKGESTLWTVTCQRVGQRLVKQWAHFFHRKFGEAVWRTPVCRITHDPLFVVKFDSIHGECVAPNFEIMVVALPFAELNDEKRGQDIYQVGKGTEYNFA